MGDPDAPVEGPRRWSWRRRLLVGAASLLGALLIGGAIAYRMLMPGAVFLTRLVDARPEAQYAGQPFSERSVVIPAEGELRALRAHLVVPERPSLRTIVLVHGAHHNGIDEPRLLALARKLAGVGAPVVVAESSLASLVMEPVAVDEIVRAVRWTLDDSGLVAGDGKVGLMGICVGGGLTICAASREAIRDRVGFVFAIGAHAEMGPVRRYLCSGQLPGGGSRPPDHYGTVVVLINLAADLLPAEQVAPLRACLLRYQRDGADAARAAQQALPEPARDLARLALDGHTLELGSRLLAHVDRQPGDALISPLSQPAPPAPAFLLHSASDKVVPPEQAPVLGEHLGAGSEVLVSPLFSHVDPDAGDWGEMLKLASFITRMLRS